LPRPLAQQYSSIVDHSSVHVHQESAALAGIPAN
jgi:hypothetical protein